LPFELLSSIPGREFRFPQRFRETPLPEGEGSGVIGSNPYASIVRRMIPLYLRLTFALSTRSARFSSSKFS